MGYLSTIHQLARVMCARVCDADCSTSMTWSVIASTAVGRRAFKTCYDQRSPACSGTFARTSFTW